MPIIKSFAYIFNFAEKSNNVYEMKPQGHTNLVMENK